MTTTASLASAINSAIKERGLTVTDLISRSGVSRAAAYRLLKGGDVQLSTLLALMNVLGLDLVPIQQSVARHLPDASSPNAAARSDTKRENASPLSSVQRRRAALAMKVKGLTSKRL